MTKNGFLVALIICAGFIISKGFGQYVSYKLNQPKCSEYESGPTYDCRWPANLDAAMDYEILKGKVVAYQIQWSNGGWTDWYVPGFNDIDSKYNPGGRQCSVPYEDNSLRRMWSYFYDHTHKYILCHSFVTPPNTAAVEFDRSDNIVTNQNNTSVKANTMNATSTNDIVQGQRVYLHHAISMVIISLIVYLGIYKTLVQSRKRIGLGWCFTVILC